MKTFSALAGLILFTAVAFISLPAGSVFAGPHHPGSGKHHGFKPHGGYQHHYGTRFYPGPRHFRRTRYYRTGGYYVVRPDCRVLDRYINADGYEVIIRQCDDGRIYRTVME